jgi:hypothetical protein
MVQGIHCCSRVLYGTTREGLREAGGESEGERDGQTDRVIEIGTGNGERQRGNRQTDRYSLTDTARAGRCI